MTTIEGDYLTYFATIVGALHGVQVIAERFQMQLRSLLYKGDMEMLKTRLQAANTYFAPKLQQTTDLIADCPLHSTDVTDAAMLKQSLSDLYADLSRTMYVQAHIRQKPAVNDYFRVRGQAVVPPLTLNIYAQQRKKRAAKSTTPRTSATAFESLSLLYKGNSIQEIATIRNLTPRTIMRHLAGFVDKGALKLSDFTHEDAEMLSEWMDRYSR